MEELRGAQFFQRAGGKTLEEGLELATRTPLVEPAVLSAWLAGSSPVLTAAVR